MATVLPETHRVIKQVLAFPAPTAALVNGRCLGGGFELALACDDILATESATFGLPEIRLAAFPPVAAAVVAAARRRLARDARHRDGAVAVGRLLA